MQGKSLAKFNYALLQDGQSPDITEGESLSELKAGLEGSIQYLAAAGGSNQFLLYTTPYLVSLDPSTGLQWGKMTQEQALLQSTYLQSDEIETLNIELLKKVQMH